MDYKKPRNPKTRKKLAFEVAKRINRDVETLKVRAKNTHRPPLTLVVDWFAMGVYDLDQASSRLESLLAAGDLV